MGILVVNGAGAAFLACFGLFLLTAIVLTPLLLGAIREEARVVARPRRRAR